MSLLKRRVGSLLDQEVVRSVVNTIFFTAMLAVCVILVLAFIHPERLSESWWLQLGALCAATGVGAFIAFLGARILRMPELGWLLGERFSRERS